MNLPITINKAVITPGVIKFITEMQFGSFIDDYQKHFAEIVMTGYYLSREMPANSDAKDLMPGFETSLHELHHFLRLMNDLKVPETPEVAI